MNSIHLLSSFRRKSFNFFGLPREIRDHIYSEIISHKDLSKNIARLDACSQPRQELLEQCVRTEAVKILKMRFKITTVYGCKQEQYERIVRSLNTLVAIVTSYRKANTYWSQHTWIRIKIINRCPLAANFSRKGYQSREKFLAGLRFSVWSLLRQGFLIKLHVDRRAGQALFSKSF